DTSHLLMACWYLVSVHKIDQQIYQQIGWMSAHEGRTSLDVKRSTNHCKKCLLAYFIGRRWTLLGVDGQLIWWARQDSNLQPDRYERPALTIELQAPPRA